MKTNQKMTVQIGHFGTLRIGHLSQMGDVAQVIEMGNRNRELKGLKPLSLDDILAKQELWEFVIALNTRKIKELKYRELENNDSIDTCQSNFEELKKFKSHSGLLRYSELMKMFPHLIKSKRGKGGGTQAELYILFYVLEEFGLNFDISNEYLHEYNLIKNLAIQNHNNSKTVSSKVYVLTDGFFYKIGSATNVQSRINKLQSGNPHTIKEFFSYSVSDSLKLEKSLHKKYAEKRMSGEWFNLTEKDLKEIESLILKSV